MRRTVAENDEYFEVYDPAGNVVGRALRRDCHGHPELRHRTSHVAVFHPDGRLLLQKRAGTKDIQPGKWDTAVGGHLRPGEDYEAGARREMHEELGIAADLPLFRLFELTIANPVETEEVGVFGLVYAGPFEAQAEEIDELRFWTREELLDPANRQRMTPNLLEELKLLFEWANWPPVPADADGELPPEEGSAPPEEAFSFRRTAWRRFWSDPVARIGVAGILLLFVPSLLAPFLANGRPLLLRTSEGWSMPFLRYFFAPDTTEVLIEQLFNYALLLIPLLLAVRRLSRRRPKRRWWLSAAAALLCLAPFVWTKPVMDKTDFRAVLAADPANWALFAPVPYSPYELVASPYEKPSAKHWMGTDDIGRDVTARMLYGGRVSLAVGILATVVALVIGTALGLCTGYFGGKFDLVTMRMVEIIICFPTFLLLLILMAIFRDWKFEQSILIIIGVLGLTGWIGLCQLVRGEVLKHRTLPYIRSCEAIGLPVWRTMLFHLLPNVSGPILISFSFAVAGAILSESSLSFLGFGVQPPTASWGGLLRQAFNDPFAYWHLTLWPGLALFIAVSAFNFTGEGMRKIFDPKA